jgi:hypothetical protein
LRRTCAFALADLQVGLIRQVGFHASCWKQRQEPGRDCFRRRTRDRAVNLDRSCKPDC